MLVTMSGGWMVNKWTFLEQDGFWNIDLLAVHPWLLDQETLLDSITVKALDCRVVASYRWIQNESNHIMEEADGDFCLFQLLRVQCFVRW